MKTLKRFFLWLWPDSLKASAKRFEKDGSVEKSGEVSGEWKF